MQTAVRVDARPDSGGLAPFAVSPPGRTPTLRQIPEETVLSLAKDMNRVGFAEVSNYLCASDLAELQGLVEEAISNNGGEYIALTGKESVLGTLLDGLSASTEFQDLLHRLYEVGTDKPAPSQGIYQVLRCLKGRTGVRQSMIFHFDSYVVTALIPIKIPKEGRAGHLIMAPNLRKERSVYFLNIVDKIMVDNRLSQLVFKALARLYPPTFKQLAMTPGSLYLFWGYRSLHANEPCDVENVRATALFHFGDPHASSLLRRRLGRQKV